MEEHYPEPGLPACGDYVIVAEALTYCYTVTRIWKWTANKR